MIPKSLAAAASAVVLCILLMFSASCAGTSKANAEPSVLGHASESGPRELESVLEPIRADYGMVALGGAIIRNGKLEAIGATGLRKKGSPERVTRADVWHLGSCTKAMTATVIAMLVEEGKLRWDQTLAESFPELADKMNPDYRNVTLEQVLNHRGGLPENVANQELWMRLMMDSSIPPMKQRSLLVEDVLARRPAAAPGTKMIYSNTGYAIAGMMAERATNTPWEDLITERLFQPLGMTTAGFGPPNTGAQVDQPWGHTPGVFRTTPASADNPPAIAPAGTVHASLEDWGKFVSLHLMEEKAPVPLLRKESFAKLHSPPDGEEYAMGWIATNRQWGGGRVYTHSGSNTMWFCTVWMAPEKGVAILVTTNEGAPWSNVACDDACGALLKAAGLVN